MKKRNGNGEEKSTGERARAHTSVALITHRQFSHRRRRYSVDFYLISFMIIIFTRLGPLSIARAAAPIAPRRRSKRFFLSRRFDSFSLHFCSFRRPIHWADLINRFEWSQFDSMRKMTVIHFVMMTDSLKRDKRERSKCLCITDHSIRPQNFKYHFLLPSRARLSALRAQSTAFLPAQNAHFSLLFVLGECEINTWLCTHKKSKEKSGKGAQANRMRCQIFAWLSKITASFAFALASVAMHFSPCRK